MGIADWFRRTPASVPATDVRSALISAVAAKNAHAVTRLFRDHRDAIREQFAGWTKVPMEMRNDEALLAQYAEMLITVARLFEQEGDGSLMASLQGDPADSPIDAWNRDIAAAQEMTDAGRYADAARMLDAVLGTIATLRGSAVDFYRPRVLGKLGVALYQAGETPRALQVTREARDFCERIGDEDGVNAYSANLENMGAG